MKIMQFKGFQARIMKANRLTGSGTHGLPPGTGIDVLPVDAFEEPLSHWIKGAGNYVVPVDSDWGLWFDFTMNDQMNTAVLLSVKGMNPVTGQRTNGFVLEKYEENCPIHNIKFQDGLFCKKCNYKWPDQNYIAYPNTLWWDGFRTSDGKVRQFFFTEDLAKSIPELVIGKEDVIPAFGFAFFRPKTLRIQSETRISGGITCPVPTMQFTSSVSSTPFAYTNQVFLSNSIGGSSCNIVDSYLSLNESHKSVSCFHSSSQIKEDIVRTRSVKKQTAEVGVGAGAEISQDLKIDSLKSTDWNDEPDSVMRLYFVFIEQFEEIKNKGLKDLVGEKEGYLSNLPVG